jgi:hypothetical protein
LRLDDEDGVMNVELPPSLCRSSPLPSPETCPSPPALYHLRQFSLSVDCQLYAQQKNPIKLFDRVGFTIGSPQSR